MTRTEELIAEARTMDELKSHPADLMSMVYELADVLEAAQVKRATPDAEDAQK